MPALRPEISDRPPTPFALAVERRPAAVIVRVRGDVDLVTGPSLVDQTLGAVGSGEQRNVILDLAAVGFMDSTGLRGVIALQDRLTHRDGHLVVHSPTRSVRKLLVLAGLDERMVITSTLAAAEETITELDRGAPPADLGLKH